MFRRDDKATFILLGYLAQLLPWVFVSRIVFNYHYFACTVFLCLALGYVAAELDKAGYRKHVIAMNAVGVVLFVLFYPALSGVLVPTGYCDQIMKWLSSWPL